jgi:tetratricopeptide (TPR) repeat protein
VVSAARLLDIDVSGVQWKDQDEVASVSPGAYRRFTDAEELIGRPNDTGLDQGIENYQKALEIDPRFGLAYARLSIAYSRKFLISRDRAMLSLAERNADLALRYHPASAKSALSRAIVDMYSGKTQDALDGLNRAITLEPESPQVLLFKAQALRNLDRPADEEIVYRRIIAERPNYWPAYNELGFTFYRRGKYQEAAEAFAEGSAVAPRVASLFANQGTMFLLLNKKKDAEEAFRHSLQLAPSVIAYSSLGALSFQAGDYRKALDYYEKERDLRPRNDVAWRNIADCYAMIGDSARMIESYSKARDLISEVLRTNPTRGTNWMNLAFYEAKLGNTAKAEAALRTAEARGASELQSQFKRVQVLALLGRKEEAIRLLLECLDKGLSQTDVELALDLKGLIKDPRYLQRKTENR